MGGGGIWWSMVIDRWEKGRQKGEEGGWVARRRDAKGGDRGDRRRVGGGGGRDGTERNARVYLTSRVRRPRPISGDQGM
jgi:hypothetical protein